jgi:hypothetical protein
VRAVHQPGHQVAAVVRCGLGRHSQHHLGGRGQLGRRQVVEEGQHGIGTLARRRDLPRVRESLVDRPSAGPHHALQQGRAHAGAEAAERAETERVPALPAGRRGGRYAGVAGTGEGGAQVGGVPVGLAARLPGREHRLVARRGFAPQHLGDVAAAPFGGEVRDQVAQGEPVEAVERVDATAGTGGGWLPQPADHCAGPGYPGIRESASRISDCRAGVRPAP